MLLEEREWAAATTLELLQFDQRSAPSSAGQLMGMNEITEKLTLDVKCRNEHAIVQRVTTAANLSRVPCGSDKECRWGDQNEYQQV